MGSRPQPSQLLSHQRGAARNAGEIPLRKMECPYFSFLTRLSRPHLYLSRLRRSYLLLKPVSRPSIRRLFPANTYPGLLRRQSGPHVVNPTCAPPSQRANVGWCVRELCRSVERIGVRLYPILSIPITRRYFQPAFIVTADCHSHSSPSPA